MVQILQNYARSVVEKKSKDEAWKVLVLMKERFSTVFDYDNCSVPRVWTEKEDIGAIRKAALSASLKVLAVMAVIRLDGKPDEVEDILFNSLMGRTATTYLLASSSWEKVPAEATLIAPLRCKSLWTKFKEETKDGVKQAVSAQEGHMQKFDDAHRGSRVLGRIVGGVTGAAIATVAAAGAYVSGGTVAVTGAALAVKAGVAANDAVAGSLGTPDREIIAMIRRRNQDMLAESD